MNGNYVKDKMQQAISRISQFEIIIKEKDKAYEKITKIHDNKDQMIEEFKQQLELVKT